MTRFSAFISYNHRDRTEAIRLHRALERYRFPKHLRGRETSLGPVPEKLKPVFRDRDELAATADLSEAVRAALVASDALIVICSPNGARSKWVNAEIRSFRDMGKGDRIRCLVVAGEPNARNPEEEALPAALFDNGAAEPLAADQRAGQDGRRGATLKIIASLVGLPYDELRRREVARRQRRLATIAIAASIGFVAMTGLTIFAFVSRREAIEQRDLARRRTLTAERTVDFVKSMFRVSDPSEARGASITAGEILDRGVRNIGTELSDEPAVRAELGVTLADVYGSLGLYRKSDRLIRWTFGIGHGDALTSTRQWLALGDSQQRLGDYEAAARSYRAGIALARKPDSPSADQLASLLQRLGAVQSAVGDDAAMVALREALDRDLKRNGPLHADVARDLETIALDAVGHEDWGQARMAANRALIIRQRLEGPMSPSVSDNFNTLGMIAYFTGDSAAAERYYRSRLAVDEKVLGPNHPDIGATLNNIARIMIERRDYRSAEPLLRRTIDLSMRERSAEHDDFAFSFANLGIAEAGQGKLAEGRRDLLRALAAAKAHDHPNLAPIMVDLADLECRTGAVAQGIARLQSAGPVMKEHYADKPWRLAWLSNTLGACLVRAGKIERGLALLRQSGPVLQQHWPVGSHYAWLASDRLKNAQQAVVPPRQALRDRRHRAASAQAVATE